MLNNKMITEIELEESHLRRCIVHKVYSLIHEHVCDSDKHSLQFLTLLCVLTGIFFNLNDFGKAGMFEVKVWDTPVSLSV